MGLWKTTQNYEVTTSHKRKQLVAWEQQDMQTSFIERIRENLDYRQTP